MDLEKLGKLGPTALMVVIVFMFLYFGAQMVSETNAALDRNTTAITELRLEIAEERKFLQQYNGSNTK